MIESFENDEQYSLSKIDPNRSSKTNIRPNSYENNLSLHILLHKLNIPRDCLDNDQIRQHYLEEYYIKYTKAKHLLSNARKKQRKIIMTYYNEKEKQNDMNELQTIKQSLLEENEKIKKFKEALKDKLLVYQQRIQFLKDAEVWSEFDINQTQSSITESTQTCTANCADLPMINDSLHSFRNHDEMIYSDNLLDDSCPTITEGNKSDLISNNSQQHLRTNNSNFCINSLKHQQKLSTKSEKKVKHRSQWSTKISQLILLITSNEQFRRFQLISSILVISLMIFIVIYMNDFIEYLLNSFMNSSLNNSKLSSSSSKTIFDTFFVDFFSTIHQYTTSWLLSLSRLF